MDSYFFLLRLLFIHGRAFLHFFAGFHFPLVSLFSRYLLQNTG